MGKVEGMKSEWFFGDLLRDKGIKYVFENDWYDFLVKGSYKVEIKSCQITVKRGKKEHKGQGKYRIGRFDFTDKENRERQIKENIQIGFIIRHKEQFIMYGFVKANQLSGKRYLSIHQLRELRPMSFEYWILELYKKERT
ncbi:hypothetical protein LCGC14_1686600 [marine sediment metagenome]|uniref:PD(D/E)XK endonuclease domain-containing protein n=1 Tax=marine sediment metagenome TaxID=412755 RepID=A0A0F9I9K0_9ZZZZ